MFRSTIMLAALTAAASAAVVRQAVDPSDLIGADAVPDEDRTCTPTFAKCAGAPNFPFVQFQPCCDDDSVCAFLPTAALPDGGWGMFCVPTGSTTVAPPTTVASATTSDDDADATTTAAAAVTTTADDDDDATATTTVAAVVTDADGNEITTTAGPTATDEDGNGITTTAGPTATDDDGNGITTVPATTVSTATNADGSGVTTTVDPSVSTTTARIRVITTTTNATTTTTTDDDGSVCFPADATVELQDGSVVPMSDVSIGDMVKVASGEYSPVFMFTHKMAGVVYKFVTLETASGASLALTKGHYLYVNGALTAAGEVSVGDELRLASGAADVVVSVGSKVSEGLYNPQTVSGDVVVNGIVSSTYTTAVEPAFAHAILAPFRFLNTLGLHFTALESGGGVLADVAPRGQATAF